MDKEKLLQLVSLAFDIQSKKSGIDGFPYISVNITNYGTNVTVWIMDNGFSLNSKFDGEYHLDFDGKPQQEFETCMEHLERLREGVKEIEE